MERCGEQQVGLFEDFGNILAQPRELNDVREAELIPNAENLLLVLLSVR